MATRGATRDATLLAQTGSGADLPEAPAPVVPCVAVDARLSTADQLDLVL
jgi:hypothetical protein